MIVYKNGNLDPFTGTTYQGTEDVSIIAGNLADNNYGAAIGLTVGHSDGRPRRALIRFDVTSLAKQYLSIDSATLKLEVMTGSSDINASNTVDVYQLTAANAGWVEGISNGAAQSGESTWNYRNHNTTAWDSGTAGTAAADYVGLIASVPFDSNSSGLLEFSLPTSLIEEWVTGTNAGLLLRVGNESSDIKSKLVFFSSDEIIQSRHPRLVLEITPIPEPGTLTLLGFGGLVMLAALRRRGRR
jgi:hypothetical protein